MLETEIKKLVKVIEQNNDLLTTLIQRGMSIDANPQTAVPSLGDPVSVDIHPTGGGNGSAAPVNNPAGTGGVDAPTVVPTAPATQQTAQPPVTQQPVAAQTVPNGPAAPMTQSPAAAPPGPVVGATPAAALPSNPAPQTNESFAPGAPQGELDGGMMKRLSEIMHELNDPMAVFNLQKQHNVSALSSANPEVRAAILADAELMLAQKRGTIQ